MLGKPERWGYDRSLADQDWDWFHPLICSPMWEGGGRTVFNIGRDPRLTGSFVNSPTWQPGQRRMGLRFGGSGDRVDYGDNALFDIGGTTGVYTMFLVVKCDHAAGGGLITQPVFNGGSGGQGVFTWDHSNAAFQQSWTHASAWVACKYTTTLQANTIYTLHGRYNGTHTHAALNGVIETEVVSTAPASSAGSLLLQKASITFSGNVYLFGFDNRAWSDAEIYQHGRDPFGPLWRDDEADMLHGLVAADAGTEWEMIPPWKKHRRLATNVTRA